MSIGSDRVKKWRVNYKAKLVRALGGKCVICGYDRCNDALDLHHIDPSVKEFAFSKVTSNPMAWSLIMAEAKKCVLLCSNCHREFHAGIIELPKEYPSFDETLFEGSFKECRVCGGKTTGREYCSRECAGTVTGNINRPNGYTRWKDIDLVQILENHKYNLSAVGRELSVSDNAVRKRAKKLGLI